jgi:hypothetical protein
MIFFAGGRPRDPQASPSSIPDANPGTFYSVLANFLRVPAAVEIEPEWVDELWVKDARLEDISGRAFIFGMEKSPRDEIKLEGITCRNVPVFAALRESGKHFWKR